ncbi:MAG: ABC transporter ATP-binding protein [Alphaproteobacteria bacterium]|nr:ABC transporter ATP-binding protein [Alphaproteobacteria bacterium]
MEKTAPRFIWKYVKTFKWSVAILGLCVAVRQGANAVEPYFMAKIYDIVSGQIGSQTYWSDIIFYASMLAVVLLISMLISESSLFITARFVPKIRTMVINDVFEDVNRQSISYFSNEMTGNISHKVNILANNTTDFINFCHEVLHMLLRLLATTAVLSFVSLYYTLFIALWIILVTLISLKLGKIRHYWGKESGRLSSVANAMVVDSISNYSEIKSFANFGFEKINLLQALRQLRKAETTEKKVMGYIRITQQIVSILSIVGFIFFSIFMLKSHLIDTTQFIFVNTLFLNVSYTVFNMSWAYNNISRMMGHIVSALETLAVDPEIIDCPDAGELKVKKAAISFENVAFSYSGREKLFENLNVKINAGEKVGLIGLSGSGKSTFIKLISRYYDVNSGCIKINNQDIRTLTQDSLHRNIAVIPQDVNLFNRTLEDNIRYGDVKADFFAVKRAAKLAYADIFIEKFADGYQTKVGDRGVVLSGGERQRIAIARAILKNAPILIFDEATSALDSKSEIHIQKSLHNLMKGKTVIAIAHRLSTLREMDRILVFDNGKIVESGTHEDLLHKGGVYARFYNMQISGFMGIDIK